MFGSSDSENGVQGRTTSSANFGVVGENASADAPPAGSAGGAGVFGLTLAPGAAGVFGACNHPSSGTGVQGNGPESGISGFSEHGVGVVAHSNDGDAMNAFAHVPHRNGLLAVNDSTGPRGDTNSGNGLLAVTHVAGGAGVHAACNHPASGTGLQANGPESGVSAFSEHGVGVVAHSNDGDAINAFAHVPHRNALLASNVGTGTKPPDENGGNGIVALTTIEGGAGILAVCNHSTSGTGVQGNGPESGVSGFSENGVGVVSHSARGDAINGFAHDGARNGVLGHNDGTNAAPTGGAPAGNGVFGYTTVPGGSGVVGAVGETNTEGAGVTGLGPVAGRFFGDVVVTGDVRLAGADVAERFDVVGPQAVYPGAVVVLAGGAGVRVSERPYDRRVAGVCSGAGDYRPAIVLDQVDSQVPTMTLALSGKVWVQADARYGPIAAGDLLTTSSTPGHAMRALDPSQAFGAVLGKAIDPLTDGRGLIRILIALQ